jgi:RAD51-like protein 2
MNVSTSDIRDVSSLPLSVELHDLLATGGFRTVSDLHNISPIDLARELNTSHSIALSIIQTASSSSSSQQSIVQSLQSVREVKTSSKQLSAVTAKDIIAKIGTGSRALITFCKAIDDMLGGGIQVGQITEFCGVPGIGKTQLAIQLSLNVQIPEVFGGLGGECVYIDTGTNKPQLRVLRRNHTN